MPSFPWAIQKGAYHYFSYTLPCIEEVEVIRNSSNTCYDIIIRIYGVHCIYYYNIIMIVQLQDIQGLAAYTCTMTLTKLAVNTRSTTVTIQTPARTNRLLHSPTWSRVGTLRFVYVARMQPTHIRARRVDRVVNLDPCTSRRMEQPVKNNKRNC